MVQGNTASVSTMVEMRQFLGNYRDENITILGAGKPWAKAIPTAASPERNPSPATVWAGQKGPEQGPFQCTVLPDDNCFVN